MDKIRKFNGPDVRVNQLKAQEGDFVPPHISQYEGATQIFSDDPKKYDTFLYQIRKNVTNTLDHIKSQMDENSMMDDIWDKNNKKLDLCKKALKIIKKMEDVDEISPDFKTPIIDKISDSLKSQNGILRDSAIQALADIKSEYKVEEKLKFIIEHTKNFNSTQKSDYYSMVICGITQQCEDNPTTARAKTLIAGLAYIQPANEREYMDIAIKPILKEYKGNGALQLGLELLKGNVEQYISEQYTFQKIEEHAHQRVMEFIKEQGWHGKIDTHQLYSLAALYTEEIAKQTYPEQWQAARELDRPVFTRSLTLADHLYSFRKGDIVYVTSDPKWVLSSKLKKSLSKYQIGDEIWDCIYSGTDEIDNFNPQKDTIQFVLTSTSLPPVEYFGNEKEKGIYFGDTHNTGLEKNKNVSAANLFSLNKEGKYRYNSFMGQTRWDKKRIETIRERNSKEIEEASPEAKQRLIELVSIPSDHNQAETKEILEKVAEATKTNKVLQRELEDVAIHVHGYLQGRLNEINLDREAHELPRLENASTEQQQQWLNTFEAFKRQFPNPDVRNFIVERGWKENDAQASGS